MATRMEWTICRDEEEWASVQHGGLAERLPAQRCHRSGPRHWRVIVALGLALPALAADSIRLYQAGQAMAQVEAGP